MSPILLGALTGLLAATGILLVVEAVRRRRPTLADRLEPYVHARPSTSRLLAAASPTADGQTVSAALLETVTRLGGILEAIGSSAESVRRRLARSGTSLTYEELRIQQLLWATAGLAIAAGTGLALSVAWRVNVPLLIVVAIVAAVGGAAARDWWLTRAVNRRRERIESQLPDVVELLALVVGAGQGPVAAMERVVRIGRGELIEELELTLADVNSGTVLTTALTHLEERVGSLHVARLSEAISVALERGTPLADVLRAQAADAREAARRSLMEEGGRREIAQMVPVVFLILPITVVFALFPGLFVLRIGL
ncbi:type II secretion system F family protein [Actinomyces sp. MRS3W]|uniref:type II secretion system F family protein n=1 Tax=Actinomyces sp. MRS3W TaxID=2800796 RepID=UPI0028FD97EC|nr:type II secretion system F family protein [Actinomyces sp. MRS3W]MDU0348614.1 type II secretion system F family protein [Actinomyces sp. MRS3W]